MALSIKRGWTIDPINKVDRTVTAVSLSNADIKDATDIVNPSLIVNVPAAAKTDYYTKTNIIYIDAFKRWYNVENIEFENANRVVYKCSCDVLKTFANDIKANSFYVSRQENNFNKDIRDPYVPTANKTTTVVKSYDCGLGANGWENPSYVVNTIGKYENSGGYHTYVFNQNGFNTLCRELFRTWTSLISPAATSSVINVVALPIPLSTLQTKCEDVNTNASVIVNDQVLFTTDGSGFSTTSKVILLKGNSMTFDTFFNDFRDFDTKYKIYAPYCGETTVNGADVFSTVGESGEISIPVKTYLDITDGTISHYWSGITDRPAEFVKFSMRGNCGIQTPISGANYSGAKIGAVVGTAVSLAEMASGNVALGGATLAANTFSAYQNRASKPSMQYSGGVQHGSCDWRNSQTINLSETYYDYIYPTNYTHTVGKPCDKTLSGNSLTGYTKCENVQMTWGTSPVPTDTEKEQVKSLLESGVIF